MKKLTRALSVLVAAVLLLSALSITASASADDIPYNAFADYGQQTYDVPSKTGEVKIDGVVSEDEYGFVIEVNKDSEGMTWGDWTTDGFPEEEIPEILPFSIKYYVTYDETGVYLAAEIVEATLYTTCDQTKDTWGVDSLEIDIAVDAYDLISEDNYSQADMLDRVRTCYCLWDDGGEEPLPVGLCYTVSSYCAYGVLGDMGEYMITRDDNKQLTTYEMRFYWEDLYMEEKVPSQIFLNFQLHLADGRYLEYVQPGYVAGLGQLRYAVQLSEEERNEIGTDKGMALHIYNLTDAAKLNSGSTEETEAPTEEATEAPTEEATEEITEAPTQADTQAPETEAPTAAPEPEPEKNGCGSAIGMTAAVTAFAAAAAVVLKKKD